MRDLSTIEKTIVKKLCSNERQYLSDFIGDFMNESILSMNRDNDSLDLIIKNRPNDKSIDPIVKEAHVLTEKIVSIISFLLYLQRDGYVLATHLAHGTTIDPKIFRHIDIYNEYKNGEGKYNSYSFPNEDIKLLIFKYMDYSFYPTQPLKNYYKNGFKTPEQKKHDQNIFLTLIGIGLSVALSLAGLYLNLVELSQPTEIDKNQLKEITTKIDSTNILLRNSSKLKSTNIDSSIIKKQTESKKPINIKPKL